MKNKNTLIGVELTFKLEEVKEARKFIRKTFRPYKSYFSPSVLVFDEEGSRLVFYGYISEYHVDILESIGFEIDLRPEDEPINLWLWLIMLSNPLYFLLFRILSTFTKDGSRFRRGFMLK